MSERKVLIGNSLDVLKQLDAESVDVCVTSPPYWGLRDYGTDPQIWGGQTNCLHEWDESNHCIHCHVWKGQLGLEPNPLDYIKHLCLIFDEVKRVLKPTGACWVNLGDTYANSYKEEGIKQKSLIQIPSRFAIAMTDRGWILRNEIIWQKPNAMPCSVKDRFTVDFEKFFFFTKNPKYYFMQIKEPAKLPTVRSIYGKQKEGNNNPAYSGRVYIANGSRNARTTWSIPPKASGEEHCAMFPPALIDIPIRACCPPGGIVLDPFCGSGTTLQYCREHDINAIGIELNPEYEDIIRRKAKINIKTLEEVVKE